MCCLATLTLNFSINLFLIILFVLFITAVIKIPFADILTIFTCACSGSFFDSTLSLASQSKTNKLASVFSACTRKKVKFLCDCHNFVRSEDVTRCSQLKLYYASNKETGTYNLKCLRISRGEANEITQKAIADFYKEIKTQITNQSMINLVIIVNPNVTFSFKFLDKNRPKNLLVFVNPYGGNGNASMIFEEKVKPIFELAKIKYVKLETERKDHARDILRKALDLNFYDGIVCVGGDGMFTEVMNSVILSTQEANEIDVNLPDQQLIKPSIPLGIVPAGSTNALGITVNGFDCIYNSILAIVLGNKLSVDVSAVHQRDTGKLLMYSSNFMGYGFMGDTLQESEKQRWMGPQRYSWAGVKQFLQLRTYCGELKMCIEPKDGRPTDFNPCSVNCNTCKKAGDRPKDQLNFNEKPG